MKRLVIAAALLGSTSIAFAQSVDADWDALVDRLAKGGAQFERRCDAEFCAASLISKPDAAGQKVIMVRVKELATNEAMRVLCLENAAGTERQCGIVETQKRFTLIKTGDEWRPRQ